ncbi:hypothetical protein EWM64_g1196 [Hericium alpestre]|uniref:DUF1740-domain-containing protein n=1 Tax=Hericium alpestre TaxID=135208 RepID=A0A4Z0A8G5_9AGAM|nr:hypothetical protein EWM64_g1196 [Hericium alpestre]
MDPPSFSSFAPSFGSFPELKPGPSKAKESREEARSRKAREDKEKEKKHRKRKHKYDDAERVRYGSRDERRVEDMSPFDDERLKAEEDRRSKNVADGQQLLFWSDRKGDVLNVTYGRINEKEAPAITDSRSRALLNAPAVRRLAGSSDTSRYQEIDGFIKLPSRHRQEEQAYRSIEPAKDQAESEYESSAYSVSESSDEEGGGPSLTSFQEKTKALEQVLSANPSSVNAWLDRLSHALSEVPITSRNATKTRAEITLSIISRALSSIRDGPASTRLRLIRIQAGEEVWPPAKVHDEWEDALKANDIELKMAWLDWRIRGGARVIDAVLEDALRVLTTSATEMDKLRAFWRTGVILRQSGFTERALAMFQAQAELTFRSPPSLLAAPFEEQLDALEEFWESELSRFGERGANGWAAWVAAGKPEENPIVPGSSSSSHPMHTDPYRKWASQEMHADQMLRPPLRSTDPAADEDPYATVLFSDIRPLLLALSSTRTKAAFRLIWLSFLGLHIPGIEAFMSPATAAENTDDRWTEMHLASQPYLCSIFPSDTSPHRLTTESYAGVAIGQQEEYSSGFGPVKNWGYRTVGPLDAFGEAKVAMWTREDVQGVNQEFVRGVFEQCKLTRDDVEWDTLALAFEAAVNVKSSLKLSRSFLANARESIPHWAAHARLERLRGRVDDARKVYQTVLTSPASSQNKLSLGPIWYDWAELEWLDRKSDAAIQVAIRSVGIESDSGGGVVLLRAKRLLQETARSIPDVLWKVREAWLRLCALLELLTTSSTGGYPSFFTAPIQGTSAADESMAVASLSMLYHHIYTLKSAARPSVLRNRLARAVELYPDNTVILGMFLESQKGQGVWGRVKELLGDGGANRDKSVARRVTDVWIAGWEKGKWAWEIERTRSGLAAAADSERTRGSPILWRIYVEFEIRAGQLKRAKDVLMRALGHCPMVKELYLLAFDALRSVFTPRELNILGEAMAERGLRMRRGLDEALDGWTEGNERLEDEEMSGEEDEIEYNARELQRLKPY